MLQCTKVSKCHSTPLEKIFEGKLQKYSPLPSRHQNLSTLAGSGGCCMQPAVPLTLLILIFSLGWAGLGWTGLGWAGLGWAPGYVQRRHGGRRRKRQQLKCHKLNTVSRIVLFQIKCRVQHCLPALQISRTRNFRLRVLLS